MEEQPLLARLSPLAYNSLCVVVTLFWLAASYLQLQMAGDPTVSIQLQLASGAGFMLLTTALFYLLLNQYRVIQHGSANKSFAVLRQLLPMLLALLVVVLLILFVVASLEAPTLRQDARKELEVIADLKGRQIENWLDERYGDAQTLIDDAGFSRQVIQGHKGSETAKATLRVRLEAFRHAYHYDAVSVVSQTGGVLIYTGRGHEHPLLWQQSLQKLAQSPGKLTSSFQYQFTEQGVYLTLIMPLKPANDASAAFGLVLLIAPKQFIYPYIAEWPTPSASGETLLATRDGDEVLFLTPLRYRKGQPGTITHSLSDPDLPAAVALNRGTGGMFTGRDYREVEVIAAHRPIAGTDWQLIAKRDLDEVMQPLYLLLLWVGIITLTCALVLALLLQYLWRQQQQLHELRIQAEKRRTDSLLQQFFELPFIGVAVTSPQGKRWLRFNQRLCDILGYTSDELDTLSWADVTHPDDIEADVAEFDRVIRGDTDGYSMDKRYIRKDGSVVDVYIDVKCIRKPDGKVDYFIAMVQDISERKAAEQRLHDSHRLLNFALVQLPIPVIIARAPDMMITHHNPASDALLVNRPADTAITLEQYREHWPAFHPDGTPLASDDFPLSRAILKGESIENEEIVLRLPDGDHWVSASAAPLCDESGAIISGIVAFPEISEQKRAQQAIELARRQAQQYLDIAGVMLVALDRQGGIELINRHACKILGYQEQALLGRNWFELCLPEADRDETFSVFNQLMAGDIEAVEYFENPVITSSNEERLIAWRNTVIRDDSGAITTVLSSGEDVTDKQQAQQALESAHRQARQYLSVAGVMLVALDGQGRIQLVNRRACDILGYQEQELLGEDWLQCCLPERDRAQTRQIFEALLAGKQDTDTTVQQAVLTRSGAERMIRWRNVVMRDGSGAIIGTLSSGEDITDLRQSEARLRTLVDTIPDLVWLKDAEGVYLACNPMFERFFGAPEAEIVGKTDYDFVDRELADFFREHDLKAMAAGKPSRNEETLTFASDGYPGVFETVKSPMCDSDGKLIGVLGIARDISERKQATARLARLSQLYATLSQTNQSIVRSRDEDELFEQVCRNAVEYGGFSMAWVGRINEQSGIVEPLASYGDDSGYVDAANIRLAAESPSGNGPVGRALRNGEPYWCQDFLNDEVGQPWHDLAEAAGFAATAALPIYRNGQIYGGFTLYSDTTFAFDAEARDLLVEMATDISFALDHFDQERQRHEAEKRLELVIKGSNDASWDWDIEHNHLWYSPRWWQLLGYEVNELPADPQLWRRLAHPDDIPVVDETVARLIYQGDEWGEVECRQRHKDGHYIPTLIRGFGSRDEDGKLVRISGTTTDLTERKLLEQQLRQQRDELSHAKQVLDSHLDNSPVGVIEWDPAFRIIRWSKRAQAIFGWREEEVLGKHPSEFRFVHEDDDERVGEIINTLITGEQIRNHITNRNVTRDGSVIDTEWYNSALHDEQGKLLSVLSLVQDITEQHQAEEELRRRENLLQKTFDILPIGLWFADASGQLLRGNPAGQAIWGGEPHVNADQYDVFKARRLPSGDPVQPDDWALAHTVREGVTVTDELLEIEAFDGKRKIILNYTAPVIDEQGRIEAAIVVNLDITERQRVQQQLQERVDELDRWYEATLGREERLLELKQEINRLLKQTGQPPRYPSAEDQTSGNPTKEPPA